MLRHLITKDEIGDTKIHSLRDDIRLDAKHVIFLTPPSVQNMHKISSVIKANIEKEFHLAYVPRRTFACKEALLADGVYGSVKES